MLTEIGFYGWVAAAGAVGGSLNAFHTHNRQVLPSRMLVDGRHTVLQTGLVTNAVAGAASAIAALRGFAAAGCAGTSIDVALLAIVTALIVGGVVARVITSESDKLVLRAALRNALRAPAAHPASIMEVETQSALALLKLSTELLPQGRRR